jgi:DUF1680 family protein
MATERCRRHIAPVEDGSLDSAYPVHVWRLAQAVRRDNTGWNGVLYRPARSRTHTVRVKAVPYALRSNRSRGKMLVWIREQEKGA